MVGVVSSVVVVPAQIFGLVVLLVVSWAVAVVAFVDVVVKWAFAVASWAVVVVVFVANCEFGRNSYRRFPYIFLHVVPDVVVVVSLAWVGRFARECRLVAFGLGYQVTAISCCSIAVTAQMVMSGTVLLVT